MTLVNHFRPLWTTRRIREHIRDCQVKSSKYYTLFVLMLTLGPFWRVPVKVGITGLPQVGKTTIFSLLTGGKVDVSSWSGKEAHVGIARVPDVRVDRLAGIFRPRKTTYATVEYVDLPALSPRDAGGERAGPAMEMAPYLTSLKNADALLEVVRAFDDRKVPNPEGPVDPKRDIVRVELEMILSDLAVAEKRLARLE